MPTLQEYLQNLMIQRSLATAQPVTEAEMYRQGDADRAARATPYADGAGRAEADDKLALSIAINGVRPGDLDGLDHAQRRAIGAAALAKKQQLAERDQLEAQGHRVIPMHGGFVGTGQGGTPQRSPAPGELQAGADPREAELSRDGLDPSGRPGSVDRPPHMGEDRLTKDFRGMTHTEAFDVILRQLKARQMAQQSGVDPRDFLQHVW